MRDQVSVLTASPPLCLSISIGAGSRVKPRDRRLQERHRRFDLPERGSAMADDKSKQDNRDRSRSSAEDYEVRYVAEQGGISRSEALALLQKHGNDREVLMREAKKLRGSA